MACHDENQAMIRVVFLYTSKMKDILSEYSIKHPPLLEPKTTGLLIIIENL